ncbi:MAG: LysM peptidoglycan-binding domain-containing protein [Sedimentisphaerales bacterium]|nr:LysM peptidoglycan-binding domain-containing protein [Sedimentisphaerales bacterium]
MRNAMNKNYSLLLIITVIAIAAIITGCQSPPSSGDALQNAQPARPRPQRLEDVPYSPLNTIWPNENQWSEPGFSNLKLAAAPQSRQITHRVQPGETLTSIARLHYNDPTAWKRIYTANRQILTTPDRLHVGMNLVIPETQSR